MWELTKTFRFEAAHTLERTIHVEASRRIHGHSYRAVVAVRGEPDAATGMVVDLGELEANLAQARHALDHRLLDELPELGPATLENLSAWIWHHVATVAPGLVRVTVHRDSLDESCSYFGPA
jgi:6-pyruvoyltetrahydropterin/6-carboxytetrahydropterin synthase